MSYKILGKTRTKRYVEPGDTVHLYYTDANGISEHVLSADIETAMKIDRAIVFEAENEMGLEKCIGGAFGKAKKR